MAVFDSASNGFDTSTTNFLLSHTTTGSDRMLIVSVVTTSTAPTSVTYNGVSMTQVQQNLNYSSTYDHTVYYLEAPATGANDISVTVGSSQNIFVVASSYTDVDQGAPDTSNSNTTGVVDEYNTSLTPTVDDCWVVLCAAGAAHIIVKDDGTLRAKDSVVGLISDNNAAVNPAASTQLDSERSSSGTTPRSHIMLSLAPAGAAPAGFAFSQAVVIA